jgi:hypothetical protein
MVKRQEVVPQPFILVILSFFLLFGLRDMVINPTGMGDYDQTMRKESLSSMAQSACTGNLSAGGTACTVNSVPAPLSPGRVKANPNLGRRRIIEGPDFNFSVANESSHESASLQILDEEVIEQYT